MAVVPTRVTASNPAQKLAENTHSPVQGDFGAQSFVLRNLTQTATVYLGSDATVTNTGGFPWYVSDQPVSIELEPGESVWGYASSAQAIAALKAGR